MVIDWLKLDIPLQSINARHYNNNDGHSRHLALSESARARSLF